MIFTKPAQASKKPKKPKHDLHKTCAGIKKTKKTKTFVIYRPPTLSRCSEFCFFCFFWCLCRFCASSGLFFFVFFDACAGFVTLTFTKHAQASKKQKNQSMIFTKPAQASKKPKKPKLLWSIDPQPWVDAQSFVFFGFFDACAGFVHLVVWFFWFFWCLCRFCDSNLHQTCTGIKKANFLSSINF